MRRLLTLLLLLALAACGDGGPGLAPGARLELVHEGRGHELHLAEPAVGVAPDGGVHVAWASTHGDAGHVWTVRADAEAVRPLQVDPPDLAPASLHQGPGLAVGPGGELYVSWSSRKPKPEGVLFASDLRLSRSLDGGRSFGAPLRVNEDHPVSHSFEGMAAAEDGSVLVAWIDAAQEGAPPGTRLARVVERGSRVEAVQGLGASTCVCCRVHVAAGRAGRAAVLWREELPGSVRDMVLALSDDGRSFAAPELVHADGWRFEGCPHRGGAAAFDGAGRLAAAWYTEGGGGPSLRLATRTEATAFSAPRELQAGTDTIPDRVALALAPDGTGVVAWETLTAVRREIRARALREGGRVVGPVQEIPLRGKARAPALAVAPDGAFWLAFHEEAFPETRTVVQQLRVVP